MGRVKVIASPVPSIHKSDSHPLQYWSVILYWKQCYVTRLAASMIVYGISSNDFSTVKLNAEVWTQHVTVAHWMSDKDVVKAIRCCLTIQFCVASVHLPFQSLDFKTFLFGFDSLLFFYSSSVILGRKDVKRADIIMQMRLCNRYFFEIEVQK